MASGLIQVFDQDVLLLSSMMREIDTEQDADGDSSLFAPFSRRSLGSFCFILFQVVARQAKKNAACSCQVNILITNSHMSTHLRDIVSISTHLPDIVVRPPQPAFNRAAIMDCCL